MISESLWRALTGCFPCRKGDGKVRQSQTHEPQPGPSKPNDALAVKNVDKKVRLSPSSGVSDDGTKMENPHSVGRSEISQDLKTCDSTQADPNSSTSDSSIIRNGRRSRSVKVLPPLRSYPKRATSAHGAARRPATAPGPFARIGQISEQRKRNGYPVGNYASFTTRNE